MPSPSYDILFFFSATMMPFISLRARVRRFPLLITPLMPPSRYLSCAATTLPPDTLIFRLCRSRRFIFADDC